jgi:Immunity protein 35
MLDYEAAREIVLQYISENHPTRHNDNPIIIDDSSTIEQEWGWIFSFQGKRWVENKEHRYLMIGVPTTVVVEKSDGGLYYLPNCKTIEECISEYLRFRKNMKLKRIDVKPSK